MKITIKKLTLIMALLGVVLPLCATAQSDSLSHYLMIAAQQSPTLKAEYLTYRSTLEKIPQAGAISDPQLEIGFFLQPMAILDGKQVSDFKLMQMFPWFGTRKAARSEATEMSRMAFEKFRESRDQLLLEVKQQYATLAQYQQQLRNIEENRILLVALKELATNRFSTPKAVATATSGRVSANTSTPINATPSSGMKGMSGMGSAPQTEGTSVAGNMDGMSKMNGNGSMGSGNGFSDVLRIQLQLNELDYEQESTQNTIDAAKKRFNALLYRPLDTPIILPDSIHLRTLPLNEDTIIPTIIAQNPMLAMLKAESASYQAKSKMDQKMGLPMIGIGIQYSIIGKRNAMDPHMGITIPTTAMNGKDMWMPMVSLSLPIYRNKYKALQHEDQLLRDAANQRHAATIATLMGQYAGIKQQLIDANRKARLYQQQTELAHTTYQVGISEYAAGLSTLSNLLDIRRELLGYEIKYSEAITAYNVVVAQLELLISETVTE